MHRNHRTAARVARLLLAWFRGNARDLPWRRTSDPYAIWVAEVMLQQTQVRTVIPYWERWMQALPTLRSLARARPERLRKLWEGLGYYRRARHLQQAARIILEQHAGVFPRNVQDLLALPGIGRYTAGAVCSIAFNQPTPVVDGNVVRVLTRLFGIVQNPQEQEIQRQLWGLAEDLVQAAAAQERALTQPGLGTQPDLQNAPPSPASPAVLSKPRSPRGGCGFHAGACADLNQSLMELGAVICTPKSPRCPSCPVRSVCSAFRTDRTDQLPQLRPRLRSIPKHGLALVLENRQRFLACQRPPGLVNAHLWEFPNFEVDLRDPSPEEVLVLASAHLQCPLRSAHFLGTIKHAITRYRIVLDVYAVTPARRFPRRGPRGRWLTARQLDRLALASAHRRILRGFLKA